MDGKSRLRTLLLVNTIFILTLLLTGCRACTQQPIVGPGPKPVAVTTPGPSPTETPDESKNDELKDKDDEEEAENKDPQTGGSFVANVQRYLTDVLVNGRLLRNSRPRPLSLGARVATNEHGQALLNLGECGSVFLFNDSGFVMSSCPKSEYGRSGTCASIGTFAYNNSCTRKFRRTETPSSEIELLGTGFGVIYRPQENLSLVLVSKGAVRIRPVVQMKNRVLDGKPSEGVEVGAGFFYYTTPGREPADIGGVPQREARPFSELPKLTEAIDKKAGTEEVRTGIGDIRNWGKFTFPPGTPLPPTGRNVIPPPSFFNFVSPAVGIPQSKEIVLTVKDNVPVTFQKLYISGVNHSDFKLTADECSEKTIITKCTFMSTFTPQETTRREAILNIPSNADNSPNSISLTGIVGPVPPGPGTTTPNFSVTESRTFEIQKISTQSPPKVITVTNEGASPIVITGVEVKGVGGNFKPGTDNCLNQKVEPQGKCTVEVLYTPQTEGLHMANLLVTAKSTSPVAIAVSSPVASKSAELSGRGGMPLANFAADVMCFDRWKRVKSGESTIRESLLLYVTNSGTVPLTVSGVDIEGANKQDFSVTENTCRVVDINGNCRITVGFTPTEEKVRKGSLVITHDGSGVQKKVPLAGVGKPRNWFLRLIDRLRTQKKPC